MILLSTRRTVGREHWALGDVVQANRVLRSVGCRMCNSCRRIQPLANWSRTSSCCRSCHVLRTRTWERHDPDRAKVGRSIRDARRRSLERQQSIAGAPVTWQLLARKLEYWSNGCYLCGLKVPDQRVVWDHVKPLSRGGLNIIANLRPTHATCNLIKGSRDHKEFIMSNKHRGTVVTLEQLAQEDRQRGNERQYARVVRAAKKAS